MSGENEEGDGVAIEQCVVGRKTIVIGTYGGGDNLSMAPVGYARRYPLQWSEDHQQKEGEGEGEGEGEKEEGEENKAKQWRGKGVVLAKSFQDRIIARAQARIAEHEATPAADRIYEVPPLDSSQLQYSFSVVVSGWSGGSAGGDGSERTEAELHNFFAQGWLFAEELEREPERLGVGRYPLCGIFSPSPHVQVLADDDGAFAGVEGFQTADQHCHLVTETLFFDDVPLEMSDWHVGSDMARFLLQPSHPPSAASALFVVVDPFTSRCEITLMIIHPAPCKISFLHQLLDDVPHMPLSQLLTFLIDQEILDASFQLPPEILHHS